MRYAKTFCVLTLFLLSGACSREEGAAPPGASPAAGPAAEAADSGSPAVAAANAGHDYACADGSQINARLDHGNIALSLGGQTLTLSPVQGASGAQYAGGGVTFIAQGEQAMLSRDGARPVRCTAK